MVGLVLHLDKLQKFMYRSRIQPPQTDGPTVKKGQLISTELRLLLPRKGLA